ncbi:hypothetical protein VE23_24950 [Paenibacillus sp. D9]|nr:hypothetical protein VE23_24950 [Paenibacillus sp. D9]
MNKQWEPCPRCGSSKSFVLGKGILSLILFMSSGLFLILGIFLFPFLFVAPVLFFLSFIIPFLPFKKRHICQDYKHNWTVQKKIASL